MTQQTTRFSIVSVESSNCNVTSFELREQAEPPVRDPLPKEFHIPIAHEPSGCPRSTSLLAVLTCQYNITKDNDPKEHSRP